jgi:hypothetical protein
MSLNDWPPRENHSAPSPRVARWFQKQLDHIAGFAPGGYQRLRLFWGQEMRERDRYPGNADFSSADWLEHYAGWREVCTGWVAHFPDGDRRYPPLVDPPPQMLEDAKKYSALIDFEQQTKVIHIGMPRWYVHKWRPHTALDAASYAADRVAYDVESNTLLTLGPDEMTPGQWSDVVHIITSEHDDYCCDKAEGPLCYAYYRDPDQGDLDYLAALWAEKQKDEVTFAEGEVMPERLAEQLVKSRIDQLAAQRQKERDAMRFRIKSILRENKHRWLDLPRSGFSQATKNTMS